MQLIRRVLFGTAAALLLFSAKAQASGLNLGVSLTGVHFPGDNGGVNFFSAGLSARVSRGRAALTLSLPFDSISGGSVLLAPSGEIGPASAGSCPWHGPDGSCKGAPAQVGFGDMSATLEYNVIQNRQRMIIVTLSGSVTAATGATGLTSGETFLGLGLSGLYGITRQLIAYADLNQVWVGFKAPWSARTLYGEVGAVYWVTKVLGVTAGLKGFDFGKSFGGSVLEWTGGLLYQLFPGMMLNLGGIGGLVGSGGPTAGGSVGFGFEL